MSNASTQQSEGIELKAMKPSKDDLAGSGHTDNPMTISHEPLIDVEDITDVEKGVYPPLNSPAVPEQEHVESAPAPKVSAGGAAQKGSFLSRIKAVDRKDKILTAVSVLAVLCMFIIIGLAVVVGFDSMDIKALSAQVHTTPAGQVVAAAAATNGAVMRDSGYMDGFSAFLDGHIYDRVVHDAVTTQSMSDACDDDEMSAPTSVQPTLTAIIPVLTDFVNLTVTTTVTSTTTNHSTSVLAISTNAVTTSMIASIAGDSSASSMSSSVSTSTTTTSSTETCGEWGDGAGPCARPYGAPNTTPASAFSSISAASAMAMSPATLTDTLLTPSASVASTPSSVAFTSSFTDASILNASAATVTVTVTEISTVRGSCNGSVAGLGGGTTFYGTSTLVSLRTSTVSGSNGGPLTTSTETVLWGNTSFATSANFTLTLKSTLAPTTATGSGFNGGAGPTGIVPLTSRGKQSVPKPMMGMMSDGATGSGVYCTVMLVVIIALLS